MKSVVGKVNIFMAIYNRYRYPTDYKRLKFEVAMHNEKVTMMTEIQQHGHLLLKGITTT